jgi:hypothetical protein
MYQESLPELACTELAEVSKAEDNRKIAFDKLRQQHFGKLSASGYNLFWKSPKC